MSHSEDLEVARLAAPAAELSRRPRALITGATGQDGSYLARLLLEKGYEVHGIMRRSSTFATDRIEDIYQDPHEEDVRFHLHYGDLSDATSLSKIVEKCAPDEIYNLGAQSHVKVSFEQPAYTADIVATGTLRLLEALRDFRERTGRDVRVYQAGSSEMFGAAPPPQTESTPFYPRSPYGASKAAAFWYAKIFREAYGLFVCNGILFNHESPQRTETFVSRKITRAVGRIYYGLQRKLYLGNLDARRDWGFAGDYVEAMWQMLQQPEPDDYVIATGEAHTVREFLEVAFGSVGLDWAEYVEQDPRHLRPSEVDHLLGDATKARKKRGWRPSVKFPELVDMMLKRDLDLARSELLLAEHGHNGRLRLAV